LDPAFEDVRQQLLDVRTRRGGTAGDGDIVEEARHPFRDRLLLGNSDAADGPARADDAQSRNGRLLEADALEDRVGAEAVGELAHARDRRVASVADDARCAERIP